MSRHFQTGRLQPLGSGGLRVATFALLAVACLITGCQRQTAPELPFDPAAADSLRTDLDGALEGQQPTP